jgi:hypothetical protein
MLLPGRLVGVCRDEDLLELVLGLHGFDPLLLNIPVGGLPHKEVLDDALHRLPRQKVFLYVVEVLAVLLDGFLVSHC